MKTIACHFLDTKKIPYSINEYPWSEDELDAITVAGKIGMPPEQVFKTLVLHGDKTKVLMACIPGNKELDLKALASVSGNKKVEMVAVKELQGLTGYIRGGVSPLGIKKHYPLFIDQSAADLDTISISAGKRGMQIFLKGSDLVQVTNATLADISR